MNQTKQLKKLIGFFKKKQHLFISVPLIEFEHGSPYDYFRYTKHGIEHLLKKNDFKIVEFNLIGSFLSLLVLLINRFLFYDLILFNKNRLIRYIMILFTPIFTIITTVLNSLSFCFSRLIKTEKYIILTITARKIKNRK